MTLFKKGTEVRVKADHPYLRIGKGSVGRVLGRDVIDGVQVEFLVPRVITFQPHELKPLKKDKR